MVHKMNAHGERLTNYFHILLAATRVHPISLFDWDHLLPILFGHIQ